MQDPEMEEQETPRRGRARGRPTTQSQKATQNAQVSQVTEIEADDDEVLLQAPVDEFEQYKDEPEKLRELLRLKYRNLLTRVQDERQTMTSQGLVANMKEGEKLFNQIKKEPNPREAALDYEWYDLSMSLAVERAQKMETGFRGHSMDQFLTKMSELVEKNTLYEEHVRPYFASETASGRLFLYGALAREGPVRQQKERRQKDPEAEKVQPTTIENRNREEADLTKRVRALKKDLDERTDSGANEVLLWPLITNPKSFATSVENLFHFAFLIHDGVASLREDKQGELYCNLAEKPQTQNVSSAEVKTQQRAIALTPQLWEANKKKFYPNYVDAPPKGAGKAKAVAKEPQGSPGKRQHVDPSEHMLLGEKNPPEMEGSPAKKKKTT